MTDRRQWSRRQWLATAGSTAAVGLAGCSSDDGTGGTDDDGSTPAGNDDNGDTSNPDGDTNTQSFEGPVTADGEWPLKHLDATNTRATTAVSGPPVAVQERWSNNPGEMAATPVVAGETVYAGTRAGTCYAYDLLSGEQNWSRSLGSGTIHDLAADGDRVIVGRRGGLTALTLDNSLDWEVTEVETALDVTVYDGTVYATAGDVLHARDAASGNEVWTTDVSGAITRPAVVDGTVVTKDRNALRVFDAATGDQRFQVEHGGGEIYNTSVAVSDGTAYFMADTDIEARSIDDGSLEWEWTDGSADEYVPAVADGVVYVPSVGKSGPYRIDAETGESLGVVDVDGITGLPVVADGTVYLEVLPDIESDTRLYALDADSLSVNWQTTVPVGEGTIQSTPLVLEDIVVYATQKSVYAVAPN